MSRARSRAPARRASVSRSACSTGACSAPTSSGASNIPQHTNFIAAANHSSHLDMGLLKVALGDAGRDITSMAAADYFFRNRYRRAYFTNFTNLVPMERTGSIRKSMDTAERVLRRGKSMVVFPEGTRSIDGRLAEFLPSLGYLALRSGVGVLPAYLGGTFQSLPKGAAIPRARDLSVAFGPFLGIDLLQELAGGPAAPGGVAVDRGPDPADRREPAGRDRGSPRRGRRSRGLGRQASGAGRRAARDREPPSPDWSRCPDGGQRRRRRPRRRGSR